MTTDKQIEAVAKALCESCCDAKARGYCSCNVEVIDGWKDSAIAAIESYASTLPDRTVPALALLQRWRDAIATSDGDAANQCYVDTTAFLMSREESDAGEWQRAVELLAPIVAAIPADVLTTSDPKVLTALAGIDAALSAARKAGWGATPHQTKGVS